MRTLYIYGCEARGDYNDLYLVRYELIACRWFTLCIHVFHRSDAIDMHDHPWNFYTLILWNGYNEITPAGRERIKAGRLLFRKAAYQHRVELIGKRKAVTLVLMGKRVRSWGFITSKGWQLFTDYFKDNRC